MNVIQFSIFIFFPLILMIAMIFIPTVIGRRIPPAFTNKSGMFFNASEKELFDLLIDYDNYPKWLNYISKVHTEKLSDGKLRVIEIYKKKKISQNLLEVRRVPNSVVSIVKTEDEYTVLWSFEIIKENENLTSLIIKETMYVYHPYLRFMLRYVLRDENAKKDMFRNIKHAIRTNKEYTNA